MGERNGGRALSRHHRAIVTSKYSRRSSVRPAMERKTDKRDRHTIRFRGARETGRFEHTNTVTTGGARFVSVSIATRWRCMHAERTYRIAVAAKQIRCRDFLLQDDLCAAGVITTFAIGRRRPRSSRVGQSNIT